MKHGSAVCTLSAVLLKFRVTQQSHVQPNVHPSQLLVLEVDLKPQSHCPYHDSTTFPHAKPDAEQDRDAEGSNVNLPVGNHRGTEQEEEQ